MNYMHSSGSPKFIPMHEDENAGENVEAGAVRSLEDLAESFAS